MTPEEGVAWKSPHRDAPSRRSMSDKMPDCYFVPMAGTAREIACKPDGYYTVAALKEWIVSRNWLEHGTWMDLHVNRYAIERDGRVYLLPRAAKLLCANDCGPMAPTFWDGVRLRIARIITKRFP